MLRLRVLPAFICLLAFAINAKADLYDDVIAARASCSATRDSVYNAISAYQYDMTLLDIRRDDLDYKMSYGLKLSYAAARGSYYGEDYNVNAATADPEFNWIYGEGKLDAYYVYVAYNDPVNAKKCLEAALDFYTTSNTGFGEVSTTPPEEYLGIMAAILDGIP